jgi:hypothetical protein
MTSATIWDIYPKSDIRGIDIPGGYRKDPQDLIQFAEYALSQGANAFNSGGWIKKIDEPETAPAKKQDHRLDLYVLRQRGKSGEVWHIVHGRDYPENDLEVGDDPPSVEDFAKFAALTRQKGGVAFNRFVDFAFFFLDKFWNLFSRFFFLISLLLALARSKKQWLPSLK